MEGGYSIPCVVCGIAASKLTSRVARLKANDEQFVACEVVNGAYCDDHLPPDATVVFPNNDNEQDGA